MTLRDLKPIAAGAWLKAVAPAILIANTIPQFSKNAETIELADIDPYCLFGEPQERGGALPYDPKVCEALQNGTMLVV